MKLPKNIGLTLTYVTPNSTFLVTVDDLIEETYSENWVSPGEKLLATKTQEFWTLRWKPDPKSDWYECHASSLDSLLSNIDEKYLD